jgi:NADPH-dependent 2,4-dienoyl-CoA reductase/sulfur reductase-like enzyme
MEGRVDEIRRCTACCYCFDTLVQTIRGEKTQLKCALNPELGREGENLVKSAAKKKHIVVVGGGPAGMEAARIAAIRGHKVTLYEKDDKLGGMLNLAYLPPHKEEIKGLIDFYVNEMELRHVNLKLGKAFSAEELKEVKPDAVVIATGSRALIPKIPGIIENDFVTALEVLNGKIPAGRNILVIGGGLIGVETAEYLHERDKKVSLVEMFKIATDVGPTTRWGLISRLRKKITIYPSTKVIEIKKNSVVVNVRDKEIREIESDAIVIAVGLESITELIDPVKKTGIECHVAGSCRKPG